MLDSRNIGCPAYPLMSGFFIELLRNAFYAVYEN